MSRSSKLSTSIFEKVVPSKPPKVIQLNKRMKVRSNDDVCMDLSDLKTYDGKKNTSFRYVLVVVDRSSIYGGTVSLKKNRTNNELLV